MYHYNTLYIDAKGDTIIKGKMIINPLDKPWFAQRNLQESVNYIHIIDSAEFNKYCDPAIDTYRRQQKYFQKHGRMKMNLKENTGGYLLDSSFWIHPPRSNQYRMLTYSPYPTVDYRVLLDDSCTKNKGYMQGYMNIYGMGRIIHTYYIQPLKKSSLHYIKDDVRIWEIRATATVNFTNDYFKQFPIYNSTLDAEFCKEYGFLKMHYTFENGIKIQLDFEKMTEE